MESISWSNRKKEEEHEARNICHKKVMILDPGSVAWEDEKLNHRIAVIGMEVSLQGQVQSRLGVIPCGCLGKEGWTGKRMWKFKLN